MTVHEDTKRSEKIRSPRVETPAHSATSGDTSLSSPQEPRPQVRGDSRGANDGPYPWVRRALSSTSSAPTKSSTITSWWAFALALRSRRQVANRSICACTTNRYEPTWWIANSARQRSFPIPFMGGRRPLTITIVGEETELAHQLVVPVRKDVRFDRNALAYGRLGRVPTAVNPGPYRLYDRPHPTCGESPGGALPRTPRPPRLRTPKWRGEEAVWPVDGYAQYPPLSPFLTRLKPSTNDRLERPHPWRSPPSGAELAYGGCRRSCHSLVHLVMVSARAIHS